MDKLTGLFKLVRFELPFSAGVCVVLGQVLALGNITSLFITVAGFLSLFLISASILVLNDIFDVETDRINAPHRPIASNLITKNEALLFTIFLIITGLTLSLVINLQSFLTSFILLVVGFLYNYRFKQSGIPGNLMVSFSVGMTFIFGAINVNQPLNKIVIFFAVIAALIDLGEEIAADAVDIKGDKLIKSNSFAIKYGKTAALKLSTSIFSIVIIISALPFIFNWFKNLYLIPIAIMDFILAFCAFKILTAKDNLKRKYIRLLYLGATAGLILFLMIRIIE